MKKVLGVAIVLGVVTITSWLLLRDAPSEPSTDNQNALSLAVASSAPFTTEKPPRTPPPGFLEYRNTVYHYALLYPDTMKITERKEPGTALTVTFESTIDDKQFQIYIQPYGLPKVTEERFRMDVPSGVMASSTVVMLDGVPANAFYSIDASLGETREVWFINHGFLFEVTTYAPLDSWLDGILATSLFL